MKIGHSPKRFAIAGACDATVDASVKRELDSVRAKILPACRHGIRLLSLRGRRPEHYEPHGATGHQSLNHDCNLA